jgi:hypothetical protein
MPAYEHVKLGQVMPVGFGLTGPPGPFYGYGAAVVVVTPE